MIHIIIQITLLVKVIHIVIITEIDDHIKIHGSNQSSPKTAYSNYNQINSYSSSNNFKNQTSYINPANNQQNSYKNQGNSYIQQSSYKNQSNNYNQQNFYKSRNNNYSQQNSHKSQSNNYSQQNSHKSQFNNYSNIFSENCINNFEKISQRANNSNAIYDNDSLLLNDVYGKKSNQDESTDKVSNFSNSSDFNINNLSSLFNNFFQKDSNSSNSNSNACDSNNFNIPDFETMLKFKKIFERLNSKSSGNDPLINLLYAIKPFMQDSKKSIIDQLTKFISISSALQDFNSFL